MSGKRKGGREGWEEKKWEKREITKVSVATNKNNAKENYARICFPIDVKRVSHVF